MIPQCEQKINNEYFEWTPKLSCLTESEAPTVEYTLQLGHGCKIRINNEISIVFVEVYLSGKITAVSSGNNYAVIAGLPYLSSSNSASFNFATFYYGVTANNPIPVGFIKNKIIQIQNGARGSSVERWIKSDSFEIKGSGFYFTNQ